jgi:beta-N-acetylhexosaminidase
MLFLKAQIGRLFQIGFEGTEILPETERLIREWGITSFILFRRNYESLEQLVRLVRQICKITSPVKPFLAVDQEGGQVWRFGEPFTVLPGNDFLGRVPSPDTAISLAHKAGHMVGRELFAAGINWNYAPVVDVNTNPDNPIIGTRAFGDNAARVAALGVAYTQGLQSSGVIASAKHFPGHGDTSVDSHFDLPRVNTPLKLIRRREMKPFREAVRSGAASVMVGHLLIPQLDPDLPTSLSQKAYRLLRNSLGHNIVAITDDLVMKAVARNWGSDRAATMALRAGADIAMICHHPQLQASALEIAYNAAKTRKLHPSRIASATRRIERLRRTWLSGTKMPTLANARQIVGSASSNKLLDRIIELGKPVA